MSFVGEMTGRFGRLAAHPNVEAWVRRFQARPAYLRALDKGGEYHLLLGK